MTNSTREVVHEEPVWRERSNFIIASRVAGGGDIEFEQLWVRQIEERQFELCCIPFFVYDLALGAVVETDRYFIVCRIVARSGRCVLRVWFGESFQPREEIARELVNLGSLIEWSSPNLLAVDAADEEHALLAADLLAKRERAGELIYETGRT